MKVTEKQLKEFITELKIKSVQYLTKMSASNEDQNSFRAGMEQGVVIACTEIIDFMGGGAE